MKKKKLRLKTKWKVLLVYLIIFIIIGMVNDYYKEEGKKCDKARGYTCSIKEVEEYIKYEKYEK